MTEELAQQIRDICNSPGTYFWLTEDEGHLLSDNSPLWTNRYGNMHPVSGKEALERFGVEAIDECTEKCIVRVAE